MVSMVGICELCFGIDGVDGVVRYRRSELGRGDLQLGYASIRKCVLRKIVKNGLC